MSTGYYYTEFTYIYTHTDTCTHSMCATFATMRKIQHSHWNADWGPNANCLPIRSQTVFLSAFILKWNISTVLINSLAFFFILFNVTQIHFLMCFSSCQFLAHLTVWRFIWVFECMWMHAPAFRTSKQSLFAKGRADFVLNTLWCLAFDNISTNFGRKENKRDRKNTIFFSC